MLTGGILTAQAAIPQGDLSIPAVNNAGSLVVPFDASAQSA